MKLILLYIVQKKVKDFQIEIVKIKKKFIVADIALWLIIVYTMFY